MTLRQDDGTRESTLWQDDTAGRRTGERIAGVGGPYGGITRDGGTGDRKGRPYDLRGTGRRVRDAAPYGAARRGRTLSAPTGGGKKVKQGSGPRYRGKISTVGPPYMAAARATIFPPGAETLRGLVF